MIGLRRGREYPPDRKNFLTLPCYTGGMAEEQEQEKAKTGGGLGWKILWAPVMGGVLSVAVHTVKPVITNYLHERKIDRTENILTNNPESLKKLPTGFMIKDTPEGWQRLAAENPDYTRENGAVLDLENNPKQGTRVKWILENYPNAAVFILPDSSNPDSLRVIFRQTLEYAEAFHEIAAKRQGVTEPRGLVLSGSTSYAAVVDEMNTVLYAGFLAPESQDRTINVNRLADILFHEMAHHYDHLHDGPEKFERETRYKRESDADSISLVKHKNYLMRAENMLDYLAVFGEHIKHDTLHPPTLDRIKMAVRLFAKDPTLSLEEREKQLEELKEVDKKLNTETEVRFDLMEYYHQEFAKAQGQDKRTGQAEAPARTMQELAQEAAQGMKGMVASDIKTGIDVPPIRKAEAHAQQHHHNSGKPAGPQRG